ncbi:MAG: MBL fold metallo-hydrolase [Verrucomicrobiota bacterium]|nr:MBL fold metallo-hydrolase [Verrucomicrobiota bacterium]
MKKTSAISRRQFLGAASIGAAGLWLGGSESFSARFVRGMVADAGRAVTKSVIPLPNQWKSDEINVCWLGHATVLINFFGFTILTDPVLFDKVGTQMAGLTLGRKRLVAPALAAHELPRIDLALLSHAHMDHFDLPSLKTLPAATQVITARNTRDLLGETSLKCVRELSWGESATLEAADGELEISAFEVRHWGARWRSDTHRGYNGYLLKRNGRTILFGGDTALSSSFAGLKTGRGIDLGLMPIGSYGRGTSSHCTPEEAVQMANDAGVDRIVPIHHRTFPLGKEPLDEPLQRLQAAVSADRIALTEIGQTFNLS